MPDLWKLSMVIRQPHWWYNAVPFLCFIVMWELATSGEHTCECSNKAQLTRWHAGSSERRIAALHALARVSLPRSNQGVQVLPAHAEACFRGAVFSASAAPAGSLLGFLRQPFPDMQTASFRWTRPIGLSVNLILPNAHHCACNACIHPL